MRRVVWFVVSVFLVTLLGCGHSGGRPAADVAIAPKSSPPVDVFWSEFRQAYPLHVQGVAVSEVAPDGTRTLVVAEPPPDVTFEELASADPALTDVGVRTHSLGQDGWTKDVVAHVPGSVDIPTLNARLHRILFGTAYRAYLLPVPPPPPVRGLREPQVGPPDVRDWLASPRNRVVDVVDGQILRPTALLQPENAGVYASDPQGLILWALPRGSIDDRARECRMFAVDSDLILGAVAAQQSVVIVGRRRALPIAAYPPIRYESLRALTATGDLELAQSFERGNFFAGKIPEGIEKGWDWAPIYLSPGVLDTEVGSVLNIADQLLKSWSNHGETKYDGFSYPPPEEYPFEQSIFTKVQAPSVTYNWNTHDFATLLDTGNFEYLNFADTTALPITYILGEGNPRQSNELGSALGRQARMKFAASGDPYVIRAAQYAALYQILYNFDFESGDASPTTRLETDRLTLEHVRHAIDRLSSASDAELTKAVQQDLVGSAGTNENGGDNSEAFAEEVTLLAGLRDGFQKVDSDGRDRLAKLVVSADAEDDDDEILLLFRDVLNLFVDKDALRKELTQRSSMRDSAWIRTPSGVKSQNPSNITLIGGHDIDPMPKRIVTSAAVPRGKTRITGQGRTYNPADLDQFSKGSLLDTASADPARSGLPPEPRPAAIALGDPQLMVVQQRAHEFVVELRSGDGRVLSHQSMSTSAQASDAVEYRVAKLRTGLELQLQGFDELGEDNFLRTLDVRTEQGGRLRVADQLPRADIENLSARMRVEDASIERSEVRPVDGGTEVVLDVSIPSRQPGKPGIKAFVREWFPKLPIEAGRRLWGAMSAKLQSLFGSWRAGTSPSLDVLTQEMKQELRNVTKKKPTLRIRVQDEGRSGYLVEVAPPSRRPQPSGSGVHPAGG
jgi:hypothetical protein